MRPSTATVGAAAAHSAGRVPVAWAARVLLAAGRSGSSRRPPSGRARSPSVRDARPARSRAGQQPRSGAAVADRPHRRSQRPGAAGLGPDRRCRAWPRCRAPATSWPLSSGWVDGLALLVRLRRRSACCWAAGSTAAWRRRAPGAAAARWPPGAARRARCVDVLGLVGVLLGAALLLGVPGAAADRLHRAGLAAGGRARRRAGRRGLLFAAVHLFFAVDAIFVSNAGPLAAIQRSVGLVRRHLRPSVALIVLTWLILAGMARSGTSWPATCNPRTASPWASSATRTSPAA